MEILTGALVFNGIMTLVLGIILAFVKIGVSQFNDNLKNLKTDFDRQLVGVGKEMEALWAAKRDIDAAQLKLRSELPEKYLRVDGPGYIALIERLKDIKTTVEKQANDCKNWREHCPVIAMDNRLSEVEGVVGDREARIVALEKKAHDK